MVEFKDNGEEATFRTVVRDFIGSEYEPRREQIRTEGRQAAMFDRTPSMRAWEGELAQRGWIAPAWPEQYGGAGLSVMKQFIFNEEMAEARAPRPGGIAIGMAGPTLITIGTEEQQAEHLPPILSGEAIWCQGYSEPGSGSDLASLQTRAVKDGDDWVVNGQKIWDLRRAPRRLDDHAGSHRPRRAQAQGHHLLHARTCTRRAWRCGRWST